MAGKGDMYRKVNRGKWEAAPIWKRLGKKRRIAHRELRRNQADSRLSPGTV